MVEIDTKKNDVFRQKKSVKHVLLEEEKRSLCTPTSNKHFVLEHLICNHQSLVPALCTITKKKKEKSGKKGEARNSKIKTAPVIS